LGAKNALGEGGVVMYNIDLKDCLSYNFKIINMEEMGVNESSGI
jgi:hypothetical protein